MHIVKVLCYALTVANLHIYLQGSAWLKNTIRLYEMQKYSYSITFATVRNCLLHIAVTQILKHTSVNTK